MRIVQSDQRQSKQFRLGLLFAVGYIWQNGSACAESPKSVRAQLPALLCIYVERLMQEGWASQSSLNSAHCMRIAKGMYRTE